MKKIISMLLCLVVLGCAFCMAISGTDIYKPVSQNKLEVLTELPTSDPLITDITKGLDCPEVYSPFQFMAESLTEYQQWELNRYLTYGITMRGIHALKRPLSTCIDDVWTTGNTKISGEGGLTNGQNRYGAMEFMAGDQRYNVKGETGKSDSIYMAYITFNFKKVASIDSFGYVSNSYGNLLAAADVYVSNDGENWTLVGYYDQIQGKVDGDPDFKSIDAKLLGTDRNNKVFTDDTTVENNNGAKGRVYLFDLNGAEGQFLRICATACNRQTASDVTDYNSHIPAYKDFTSCSWREMMVYGTLLDKENTVTATEPAAPQTTPAPTINTNGGGLIPTKPSKTEATEATTTAETTTAAETTAEEKSGCGSSVGVSMIAMAITAVG
ncbi:MAG: hypothetical protein IJV72_01065, partial [Clostridia bacterium]|nr:hypothetical protein [Clostridia bacterium]